MIDLLQGGEAVGWKIDPGIQITERLGDIPRCTYALSMNTLTRPFGIGDSVVISDHHGSKFKGQIFRARAIRHGRSRNLLWQVFGVGQAIALMEKRFTPAKLYENQTVGAIFKDVVDTQLSGFTYTGVEDGPTLEAIRFTENNTVFEVLFKRLPQEASVLGQRWFTRLGPDDNFLMAPTSNFSAAPFTITDDDNPGTGFDLGLSAKEYFNTVLVTAPDVSVGSIIEQQTREEQEAFYRFTFRVLEATGLGNDFFGDTLGQRGVDNLDSGNVDVVWEKNSRILENLNTTPSSTADATMALTYEGAGAVSVVVQDQDAVEADGGERWGRLDLPSAGSVQEMVAAGRAALVNHAERRATEQFGFSLPVPDGLGGPRDYTDVRVATMLAGVDAVMDGMLLSGDYLIMQTVHQSHLAHQWTVGVTCEQYFRSETETDFVDNELAYIPAGTKVDSNAPTTKTLHRSEAAGVDHTFSIATA